MEEPQSSNSEGNQPIIPIAKDLVKVNSNEGPEQKQQMPQNRPQRTFKRNFYRVSVRVLNEGLTTTKFFRRFEAQNPGISTSQWRVFNAVEQTSGYVWIPMAIDKASYDFIKSKDMTLYFGLGRVTFKEKRKRSNRVLTIGNGTKK